GFQLGQLKSTLAKMSGMRVLVIGDLIIDEYITCDALGMSQEDPTIVVTPIVSKTFVGEDEFAKFAIDSLEEGGVHCDHFVDSTRPTTRKQRFRALNKTLLRVNH